MIRTVREYTILPYHGEYAIFDLSYIQPNIPLTGYPTLEECERTVETYKREDLVGMESHQWAKQAITEWMAKVAAEHGLESPEEVRTDIHLGILRAFEEVCPLYRE